MALLSVPRRASSEILREVHLSICQLLLRRRRTLSETRAHLAALTFCLDLIAACNDEFNVADHGCRKFLLISSSWIVLSIAAH